MKISKEKVQYTAQLAHLEIEEEKMEDFVKQFNQIIDYFELLNELDTSNIEPTYNVLDLKNVYREDIVKKGFTEDELLKNAPKKDGHFFCVPTTVEKKVK